MRYWFRSMELSVKSAAGLGKPAQTEMSGNGRERVVVEEVWMVTKCRDRDSVILRVLGGLLRFVCFVIVEKKKLVKREAFGMHSTGQVQHQRVFPPA